MDTSAAGVLYVLSNIARLRRVLMSERTAFPFDAMFRGLLLQLVVLGLGHRQSEARLLYARSVRWITNILLFQRACGRLDEVHQRDVLGLARFVLWRYGYRRHYCAHEIRLPASNYQGEDCIHSAGP